MGAASFLSGRFYKTCLTEKYSGQREHGKKNAQSRAPNGPDLTRHSPQKGEKLAKKKDKL
ncbi:hypothetical protein FEDK69T_21120 [Flavobacterium enshiense DK69]|uniref:Uncharacterized protein n=1 Tax=Flavobacterium enshiense DK69 TaxID=1107311 RepID=V6S654_9FLAO|nr:hypothetical protein FEDK69T_21120 [Flavobacterium enshiense DK69]KGO97148.1 hypothetical protein Q767_00655 [Flavobacterium enshiense DK69]